MSASNPSHRKKVLVTGAGGFLGSHLAADQAQRGRDVVALDLRLDTVAHLRSSGRFDLIQGDVTDEATQTSALKGVDTVYHLAAAHLSVREKDSEYWRVNVDGVRTLVENCRRAGVRRFVHCSSVAVYGRVENPPANEGSPCHPSLTYDKTKYEGEKVVLEAAQRDGFPATILRPAWVYGPGCSRTAKLFRSIEKGRFFVAGRGDEYRHCVYIRDMVEAFNLAAVRDKALGQVMIIGDARPVTVRQLTDEIARLTGAGRPRCVPAFLLNLAGSLAEIVFKPLGKEPPISRRTLKFFTANTAFDISRARRILGYEPRYDLTSGLTETYEFLRSGESWRVPLPRVNTPQVATS